MSVLAFVLIATMFAVYTMLDGYDLGVGAISLFVCKTPEDRATAMAAIGPFWNGNEVWLIAAGGALFALFPHAYASAFSGFYLPFVMVLWLLMIRGVALELRNHLVNELWRAFFDVAFAVSSGLLILLFGVSIGNVLRGVPLDSHYYFLGTLGFLLNPYALGVGLLAIAALALHGATFLALRSDGAVKERAATLAVTLWPLVLVLDLVVTVTTFSVHSPLPNLAAAPELTIAPIAAFAGVIGVRAALARGRLRVAFISSNVFIAGSTLSAAATLYPDLLSPFPPSPGGLTVLSDVPSPTALASTIAIVGVGLLAVAVYRSVLVRRIG